MTNKYTNKNGEMKLLAAVLAIAMMLVAGIVVTSSGNDLDAAPSVPSGSATEISGTITDLPSEGIIEVGFEGDSKNYKVTSNVSLTIPGQASAAKSINLYLAQGVTVTIIGTSGSSISQNITVNVIPADRGCVNAYASDDSKVSIVGLISGSIAVTNNTFGSNGVASVMTVSNNAKAVMDSAAFTQGDVRIGSTGLETTVPVSGVAYGILVSDETSGYEDYKYYPLGASVSVTLLTNKNSVTVLDGSATVTQTVGGKDNTLSLSKVKSEDGANAIKVTGGDSAIPKLDGIATTGLITVTTGTIEKGTVTNAYINAVVGTDDTITNQIPAEVTVAAQVFTIWGTIVQVNDVDLTNHGDYDEESDSWEYKDATISLDSGSTLLIEEGVTIKAKALAGPDSGNADVRILGEVVTDDISTNKNNVKVLLGSTGTVSGGLEVTGNTNVRSGQDNPITDNLYSELPENAILGGAATIPEGITYTIKANLGLNGNTLTVNGTLIIEDGAEIFGTGIAAEMIILGENGSIVNNGVIAAVTPITVSDTVNGAKINGVSGIQFGYITVDGNKKISISGEIEAVGAGAKVEAVNAVYIGADLIIGSDVTFVSSTSVVVPKGVDIIIDGELSGTLKMGTVSEIQINGKLADTAKIDIPVGTSDKNASILGETKTVSLEASTNYVSGFAVSTVNVKSGTSTSPVYTITAYISGSIVTSTAQGASATLTITGSAATQELVVAEGDEVAVASNVTISEIDASIIFDGTMVFSPRAAAVVLSDYSGATYSVKNTTLNLYTTYYTNFADAISAIAGADDKKVTADVTAISTSFTLNEKETVVLAGSVKITSDAEVEVLKGGKLQGTISKVEGLLYIEKGVTGTTVADYDSKKVDSAGNTTYAGLKVALRDSNPGDVLTIKSANVTESLTVPAGVKIVVTESLTVAGDLVIPEGSELVAPNVTVNGKVDDIADVVVEGTLDLSAGSILGVYNAVYSTGTVILGTPSENMNGAYYENDDGKIVLTTIAKAAESGEDLTVIGTVTEASDVIIEDVVFNIASSAVVTVDSITLDGASIVNDGTLTAVVKAASGVDGTAVVSVVKTTAGFATSSSVVEDDTVYVLSIDAISGTVSIDEGTVTIKTIVTAAAKSVLTIGEGAELIIAENTTISTLDSTVKIDGTVIVSKNLNVTTNDGSTKIVPLVINGAMKVEKTGNVDIDNVTVLGTLEVVKNGSFTTEAMTVGKSPLTTGDAATVTGIITISSGGYVKVYAGSVASVDGAKVASFSINGADYAVVYYNGAVTGATVFDDDSFSVPGYEEITNPWTGALEEKSYNKDLTPENVEVTVSIEPGTQLKIGALFYGTTGAIQGGMPVGTYSVSAKALPGYEGTAIVELWIDGVKQDPVQGTIKLTTDMIEQEVVIVSTFGTEPTPTPVDPSKDFIVSTSVVDDKKVIVSVISLDGGYLVAGTEVEVTFTTLVETVAFGQTVYKPTPVTETITIGDDKPTLENSTYELADILGDKYAVINVISKIGTAGFGNTSLNYKG